MKAETRMTTDTHDSPEKVSPSGYDPDFLGTRIDVPILDANIQDDAVLWEETEIIPYTHFSLSLSKTRHLARWVAWNIDGASIKLLSRTNLNFTKDPRLASDTQIGNELYSDNRLDRGHIARRADLTWGTLPEAQQANQDSFYYTNITPQMDDFNQSKHNGIWGRLENALYENVDVQDLRASVFGGPVFHPDDRTYRGIALPSEYWKLLVYQNQGTLKARAFLLTQNLEHLRALLALDEFRVYQITIDELEHRTQLHFPTPVKEAGQLAAVREIAERKPLASLADIEW